MATGPWQIYARAKYYLGSGGITLGAGIFRLSLHRSAASANIKALSLRTSFNSIGNEISARGTYAAGGRQLVPAAGYWVNGISTKQKKFSMSTIGIVFTAAGASNLNQIRYALIKFSAGAAGGRVVCYCTLSTAEFTITPPNTLTILPASSGIFTLA